MDWITRNRSSPMLSCNETSCERLRTDLCAQTSLSSRSNCLFLSLTLQLLSSFEKRKHEYYWKIRQAKECILVVVKKCKTSPQNSWRADVQKCVIICHYFWKVVVYQKDCPRSKPRTGNAFKWIRVGRMKSATVAVYAGSETQFGRTAFDEADLQTGSWLLHLSELRKSEQSRETFLRPGKHEGSQSTLHLLQLASNENCHTTGHFLRWRQTKTKNQINLFLAAMLQRSSKRAKLGEK